MQVILACLVSYIVPAILCGAAAWMAFHGKDGWCWFLLCGVLMAKAIETKKGNQP